MKYSRNKLVLLITMVANFYSCYENYFNRQGHMPISDARKHIEQALNIRSHQCSDNPDLLYFNLALLDIDCGPDKLCDGNIVNRCVNEILLAPCSGILISFGCMVDLDDSNYSIGAKRSMSQDLNDIIGIVK